MRLPALVFLIALLGCTIARAQNISNQSDPFFQLLQHLGSESSPKTPSSLNGTIELGEINQGSVVQAIDEMETLKKAGARQVYIRINSPGGSVTAGQDLSQKIETLGIPVICIGDSNVESMAYYILQSCTERWATKRTMFMVHPPSFHGVDGNYEDLRSASQELEVLNNAMIEHEAARMKLTPKQLKYKIAHTAWYFNWDTALRVGAIDKVVAPSEIPADIEWN